MIRKSSAARKLKIAFVFPHTQMLPVGILKGVVKYVHERGIFRLVVNLEPAPDALRELADWEGDGAIVNLTTKDQLRALKGVSFPIVNYGGALESMPIPRVRADYVGEATLAARHLVGRGFRNFAYLGATDRWYSQARLAAFRNELKAAGHECRVKLMPSPAGIATDLKSMNDLRQYLARLPLPCAFFVDRDLRCVALYEACWELGLRIPNDVAVIGVDNEPLVVSICAPPLSSIMVQREELGYEAMRLLHQRIQGRNDVPKEVVLPAGKLIERQSTDMLVIHDPLLRQVVEYLREHLDQPFSIKQVLTVTKVSRRWLERIFRKELGVGPAEFLLRLRVRYAKSLLRENPRVAVDVLARLAGFFSGRHLNDVFHRMEGEPLESFRQSDEITK